MEERLYFSFWFQRDRVLTAGEAQHGGMSRKLAEHIFTVQGSKGKESRK